MSKYPIFPRQNFANLGTFCVATKKPKRNSAEKNQTKKNEEMLEPGRGEAGVEARSGEVGRTLAGERRRGAPRRRPGGGGGERARQRSGGAPSHWCVWLRNGKRRSVTEARAFARVLGWERKN